MISRKEGKSKKALLVLGGKRWERDTYNVRCQCPYVYPSPHLDSNVKMGGDDREKSPLPIESLKQRELVFLFPFGPLERCLHRDSHIILGDRRWHGMLIRRTARGSTPSSPSPVSPVGCKDSRNSLELPGMCGLDSWVENHWASHRTITVRAKWPQRRGYRGDVV